jgi:hypothetical protein
MTVVPRSSKVNTMAMGSQSGLSPNDVQSLNKAYSCVGRAYTNGGGHLQVQFSSLLIISSLRREHRGTKSLVTMCKKILKYYLHCYGEPFSHHATTKLRAMYGQICLLLKYGQIFLLQIYNMLPHCCSTAGKAPTHQVSGSNLVMRILLFVQGYSSWGMSKLVLAQPLSLRNTVG